MGNDASFLATDNAMHSFVCIMMLVAVQGLSQQQSNPDQSECPKRMIYVLCFFFEPTPKIPDISCSWQVSETASARGLLEFKQRDPPRFASSAIMSGWLTPMEHLTPTG